MGGERERHGNGGGSSAPSPQAPLPRGERGFKEGGSTGWLDVLRAECERTSQAAVARRLGVSPAMVNQVLKNRYRGNIQRLRARVEGMFLGRSVECPVLGQIALNECLDHRERPFAATNPLRVRLWKACRQCHDASRRLEDLRSGPGR